MDANALKRLKAATAQLKALKSVAEEPKAEHAVEQYVGHQVRDVVNAIRELVPELPVFDNADLGFFVGGDGRDYYYSGSSCRAYVARCLALVESAIEADEPPVGIELPSFSFVLTDQLRQGLESDYSEIISSHYTKSWKAAIVLTGSCLEAILLDQVLQANDLAEKVSEVPKGEPLTWKFVDLIRVSEELGIFKAGQESLSDVVREFRNLIHPGRLMREEINYGKEEARIGLETLNVLIRDLS